MTQDKPSQPMRRGDALRWLQARLRPRAGRTLVGIDGVDGSGKTAFADDLGTLLREAGTRVIRISLDHFLNPAEVRHARGRTSAEGFYQDSYNYVRFVDEVLEPLSHEGSGRYRTAAYDLAHEQPVASPWEVAPDHAVVVVDGMFLHRDTMRNSRDKKIWDLSVWLEVPFEVSVKRLAERDGTSPDPNDPSNARYVQGQRLYIEQCDPAARADLVVDNVGPREPV